MTTPHLQRDIGLDEGLELKAYPDPLSPLGKACEAAGRHVRDFRRVKAWEALSGAPWTIGYGCTGAGIGPETVWTLPEAVRERNERIQETVAELDRVAPWWRSMCDARQDVLANMHFNMGWPKLSGFRNTLGAMQRHQYGRAADGMLASLWARQVGARAVRLARQMRTGVREPR